MIGGVRLALLLNRCLGLSRHDVWLLFAWRQACFLGALRWVWALLQCTLPDCLGGDLHCGAKQEDLSDGLQQGLIVMVA